MARRTFLGVQSTPARLLVVLFVLVLALGTFLLWLPISTRAAGSTDPLTALFTATSALTVTGLVVVDTATHWSSFGRAVLLVLVQLGGLGIVTLGSIAGIVISRNIGLQGRRVAQVETSGLDLGDVRRVLRGVVLVAFTVEAVVFVVLTATFWLRHGEAGWRALQLGGFHAVSAFNNAGLTLFPDNLARFVGDPFVNVIIAVAVVTGALGFPVLRDLARHPRRRRRWSLHTKLTLTVTAAILATGTLVFLLFEWTNPATLGELDTASKVLASGFNASMRTAGFSTIDFGATNETTQLTMILSMFIGGGSVSAAGGIKVTTLALIVLAVWAEYRGDDDISSFGRRVPSGAVRQAIAVTITVALAQLVGTMLLLAAEDLPLAQALFEATSAVGIVGLSTGITPTLDTGGQLVLISLMILGRLGPVTVGTALVLRERERLYRYPEERPFVG